MGLTLSHKVLRSLARSTPCFIAISNHSMQSFTGSSVCVQEPSYLQQEPSISVPVRQLTDFEWENPRQPPPKLEFDNAQAAFASHSSFALARSLAVFSVGRATCLSPAADQPLCHQGPLQGAVRRTCRPC